MIGSSSTRLANGRAFLRTNSIILFVVAKFEVALYLPKVDVQTRAAQNSLDAGPRDLARMDQDDHRVPLSRTPWSVRHHAALVKSFIQRSDP